MLAGERRTKRQWWFWALVLGLSPLAGLLGIYLEMDRLEQDGLYYEVGRAQAEQIARGAAAQQGLDVQGWSAYSGALVQDQLSFYYREHDSDFVDTLERLAPAAVIQVSLIEPGTDNVFQVKMGTDGRLLGFSRPLPGGQAQVSFMQVSTQSEPEEPEETPAVDPVLAEQLANCAFQQRLGDVVGIDFDDPKRSVDDEGSEKSIEFSWLGRSETNQELQLSYRVSIVGDRLSSESVSADLDEEFAEQNYPLMSTARIVAYGAMGVVAFFLSAYALFLYLRRSRQGEVSHKRNLLLGLLVAISFILVAVFSTIDTLANQLNKDISDPIFIFALIAVGCAYAFVGIYCGLMWGSGEGEVREAYPGKLTSVDTLVLGRCFSQNVASSLVIGTALGFWLLLAVHVVQLPWRSSPQFGELQSSQALLTYVRFSGLLVLLSPIISALPVAILGLLVPITCAWRWFESKSRRITFLCVLATLGCFWFGVQAYPFAAGLALTVVTAAFLVISFLHFDLLTTIATISAWSAVTNLVNLGANTSFGIPTVVLCSLGFGIFLLLEFYFSFQGQRYSEVEVHPLYAEHLAQRQALQAEVSAAREAQLRLAPQTLPEVEGLRLAAACRPSREVGGDFYDFFRIGDHRLGIFLAEGGEGGLSAALAIAFAKGLLLPMADQGASVDDMISVLEEQLEPLRESNPSMGVLLGVVDLAAGTLEHAGLGGYPRFLLFRGDESPLEMPLEPTIELASGDRIICFTDGLSTAIETAQKATVEDWLSGFFQENSTSDAHWQGEFEQALLPHIKKARRRGVDDDVSTVLIHFERRVTTHKLKEEVA